MVQGRQHHLAAAILVISCCCFGCDCWRWLQLLQLWQHCSGNCSDHGAALPPTGGMSGCQRLCRGFSCSHAFLVTSTVMRGVGVRGGMLVVVGLIGAAYSTHQPEVNAHAACNLLLMIVVVCNTFQGCNRVQMEWHEAIVCSTARGLVQVHVIGAQHAFCFV